MVLSASQCHIFTWAMLLCMSLPQCYGRQHLISDNDAATPKAKESHVILSPSLSTTTSRPTAHLIHSHSRPLTLFITTDPPKPLSNITDPPEPLAITTELAEPIYIITTDPLEPLSTIKDSHERLSIITGSPELLSITADAPEPLSITTDSPEPLYITADSPEPLSFTADLPESLSITTYSPEPLYITTDSPEPLSMTTDSPDPLSITTDSPEPLYITADLPEPLSMTTDSPEPDATLPVANEPPVILPTWCPTQPVSHGTRPRPTPLPQPHPTKAGSPSCACNNCIYGCWTQYKDYTQWGQTRKLEFSSSRIVRATNDHKLEDDQSQFGEFPWMVAVLGPNNLFIAGGSLVAPRVVLTAGHKVYNQSDNLIARVGDWDITSTHEYIPSQDIIVKEILFHPEFNRSTGVNNIALLILQKDVVIGVTVMPICLPYHYYPGFYDDEKCLVIGWNENVFEETGRYHAIKKKVSLTSINRSKCQSMLQKTELGQDFNLHWSFVCAGGLGEQTFECDINGGSPLVCPSPFNPHVYEQVGVVAWSEECGVVGNPSLFASVPNALDFIHDTIYKNGGRICSRDGDLGRLLYSCWAWSDPGRVTGASCRDYDGVYECRNDVADSGCTCSTRCRLDFKEVIYKPHC